MTRGRTLRSRTVRSVSALASIAFVSLIAASGSGGRPLDVSFSTLLPSPAFEGQKLTISVAVRPPSASCVLKIRYKGGRTDVSRGSAKHGKASWRFRIPAVPPGYAHVTVSCKGAGRVTGTMLVQWALQAPKLSITKRGWSQDGGSVSYGFALRNERTRFDAVNIAVLVNFVDNTNRVLGSTHTSVDRIPAGTSFYVGGQQSSIDGTVSRIEIVIGPAESAQKVVSVPPLISDLEIVPDVPRAFVDRVQGQLLNHYRLQMQSAVLGIVLVDGAGNIVGGGGTDAQGPLSYGAREFFQASFTFSAVPVSKAAAALVSVVPTYNTG